MDLHQARLRIQVLELENLQAHKALLAEFVPPLEHRQYPDLWSAVEAACEHHEEHHEREDILRSSLENTLEAP